VTFLPLPCRAPSAQGLQAYATQCHASDQSTSLGRARQKSQRDGVRLPSTIFELAALCSTFRRPEPMDLCFGLAGTCHCAHGFSVASNGRQLLRWLIPAAVSDPLSGRVFEPKTIFVHRRPRG